MVLTNGKMYSLGFLSTEYSFCLFHKTSDNQTYIWQTNKPEHSTNYDFDKIKSYNDLKTTREAMEFEKRPHGMTANTYRLRMTDVILPKRRKKD